MMLLDPGTAAALEQEIARLRDLDLTGLQARWKVLTGRKASQHLPKHLLLRALAYRIQADAFGDLDPATSRFLERLAAVNGHRRFRRCGRSKFPRLAGSVVWGDQPPV